MALFTVDTGAFTKWLQAFEKSVTLTPVTKTTQNMSGDAVLTEGTPVVLLAPFFKRQDAINFGAFGELETADAILLIKTTDSMTKEDKITFDGEDYRVDDITNRFLSITNIYQAVRLFRIN